MRRASGLALAAFLAALPAAAAADEIRFRGRTTADAVLIRDALQEVARFSAHALKCERLESVEASLLGEAWEPADPNYRIGPAGTRYERWDVSMCGRVEAFLIGFWAAPEGGTLFQVAHPFPPAGGKSASPPHPGFGDGRD